MKCQMKGCNLDPYFGGWCVMHARTDAPVEASADVRAGAKAIREQFLALVAEGFTESQALALIQGMLAGAQR